MLKLTTAAPPPPYTLSVPVPQAHTRESGTPSRPLPRLSHSPSPFAWPQPNAQPRRRTGKATINDLPLLTLHYILSCTLDPSRTKSRFYSDMEEEVTRRRWAMWRGLRGVNRRFYSGESGWSIRPQALNLRSQQALDASTMLHGWDRRDLLRARA